MQKEIKNGYEVLVWCYNNPMQEYIWFGGDYKERYNNIKKCFECFSVSKEWRKLD